MPYEAAVYKAWAKKNAASRRQYMRDWAAKNRERRKAYVAAFDAANKDRANELRRARYDSEKNSAECKLWRQQNPSKSSACDMKKKYARMQRMPTWADQKKITEFYEIRDAAIELFEEPFHVDHIIPLQGKLVSGLHVENNLRVLRGKENMKKFNHFEVA